MHACTSGPAKGTPGLPPVDEHMLSGAATKPLHATVRHWASHGTVTAHTRGVDNSSDTLALLRCRSWALAKQRSSRGLYLQCIHHLQIDGLGHAEQYSSR
jgi:hypothetical protein